MAADPERVVQRAAHPVLHAVVEHVVPERRRQHAEPADAHRPRAQRPGLPLREGDAGRAERPNGWYTTDVDVDWSGFPTPAATITATRTGCGDASGHESITTDGTFTPSCEVSSTVTATGANAGTSGPISETIKRDATPPIVTYTGGRPTRSTRPSTCTAPRPTTHPASTRRRARTCPGPRTRSASGVIRSARPRTTSPAMSDRVKRRSRSA